MTVSIVSSPPNLRLASARPSRRQVVVTAHGWMAGRRSMSRLNRALHAEGFETINWGYPSLRGSILQHGRRLGDLLNELARCDSVERLHLVTHSMGGIVARVAIEHSQIETDAGWKCGRLVMMAPPNAGSRLTRLPLGPFSSWFPHLTELSEREDSLVNRLPLPRRMQVSVLAASRDFVVAVAATRLACQIDHLVLPTTHQRLANHPAAIQTVVRWIQADEKEGGTTVQIPFATAAAQRPEKLAA